MLPLKETIPETFAKVQSVKDATLGGSIDRIEYSQEDKSTNESLSDDIKNSAQARTHRKQLFNILICASIVFALFFIYFVVKVCGWVQFSIDAGLVTGEKIFTNSGTGWLLEVIAFLLASLIVIPLLAAVRMANREKETLKTQAKDLGIIVSLLHHIISIISPK